MAENYRFNQSAISIFPTDRPAFSSPPKIKIKSHWGGLLFEARRAPDSPLEFVRPTSLVVEPKSRKIMSFNALGSLCYPGSVDRAVFSELAAVASVGEPVAREVQYWDGDPEPWRHGTTSEPIDDAEVIAEEEALRAMVDREDAAEVLALGDRGGERLLTRGVGVEFLVALTFALDLWEWKTRDVVRKLVKPATEGVGRCRFVDLPSVLPFVGRATVFISHTWEGRWGDCVAAAAAGARHDRIVWIDIFAVRQWPGNSMDLDFRSVVCRCSAVLVASPPRGASSRRLFKARTIQCDQAQYLQGEAYSEEKRSLPFSRLWCIVEFDAARHAGVPIVMRCAKVEAAPRRLAQVNENTTKLDRNIAARETAPCFEEEMRISFEGATELLTNWAQMADVERAECAVPVDHAREMAAVEGHGRGGAAGLTRTLRASLAAAASALEVVDGSVDAWACGEPELFHRAMDACGGEEGRLVKLLEASAAGGHTGAVEELVAVIKECEGERGSGATTAVIGRWSGALARAAFGGHGATVRFLLDVAGADPNLPLGPGRTAQRGMGNSRFDSVLAAAAAGGNCEVMALILHRGARPDADANVSGQRRSYCAPIKAAATWGHSEAVRLLLAAGADPLCGHRPEAACRATGMSMFTGIDTPLHVAAGAGHTEVCEVLLEHPTRAQMLGLRSQTGYTPLHIASMKGHVDACRILLCSGADPSGPDWNGRAPLYHAATKPWAAACMELLLEAGADPNIDHPLSLAAMCGATSNIEILLRGGADPNMKDGENATPLFHASREGFPTVVAALLKGGADASLECWGKTPLAAATQHSHLPQLEGVDHDAAILTLQQHMESPGMTTAPPTPPYHN